MTRHDFSIPDKRLLAERVGFHCSNPSCGVSTIGPSVNPNQKEYVGVAAHIYSASIDNGPRANPVLTETERSHIDNGIHLCNKCSTIIDKNNGAGYPAEILIGWKKSAEENARARIYNNNSFTIFRAVSFSNLEKSYSTALTCSGLNEKNVVSCPANKFIISEALNKLNLAYKFILKGVSGSGKSLLTYQVAYKLYKDGWSVFCLEKNNVTDYTVFSAPKDKSIIIIDDAQTLEVGQFERGLKSSHEHFFVVANWNSSASVDDSFIRSFPNIEISPVSQIELLKEYCFENKNDIVRLLRTIGISTNKKDYYERIETRIDRASKERTPWLFNYNLTEGWKTAEQDYSLLRSDEKLNLIIVTVAIYQFATLDKGVNTEVILSCLKMFCDDRIWIDKASRTLTRYCTLIDGTVKNKHYVYSRKVLGIFASQERSRDEFKYFLDVIRQILKSPIYLSGHANILEFLMFDFRLAQHELNKSGFVLELVNDLLAQNYNLIFPSLNVSKLNSIIRFNKDILSELSRKNIVLEYWLMECNRETAYPLGSLFNTLYNEKYSGFIVNKDMIRSLIGKFILANIEDKPRFTYLLNRLSLFFTEDDRLFASQELLKSKMSMNISGYSGSIACYQFSSSISDLAYICPNWADQQVQNNIDGIADLLNKELMTSYRDLRDLFHNYFGIIGAILGVKIKDTAVIKRGRELVKRIRVDSILKEFNSVETVDVPDFAYILVFLEMYDKRKLEEVSKMFDYQRLERLYEEDLNLDQNHKEMIALLHNPKSENYMGYISKVIKESDYVDRLFLDLAPELSLALIKSGTNYKFIFHDCSEYKTELVNIRRIMNEKDGEQIVRKILINNETEISKAIFNKAINVDNKKGKFDFLIFLHVFFPEMYFKIFDDGEDIKGLIEKTRRLLKGKRQEKNIARLYVFLIKTYAVNEYVDIVELEKRYPTVKSFDISNYLEKS